MLIKQIKYLLSVLSVVYFVLAGTGYNVVQFCCDDCAQEGIEFVAQHSCEAVHLEKHHDCADVEGEQPYASHLHSDIETCAHDNSCQIIRVQLDDFSVVDEIINTNASIIDLFVALSATNVLSGHLMYAKVLHEYSPPPKLFALRGREILSNKSVLVI